MNAPDKTLQYVKVVLGRDFGSEAEVVEGLQGDEKLVTNPTNERHEGMKVEIAETPKREGGKPKP